ncbi:MAG: glucokinase, partial [Nitrospinae bacterium]|nr:glucokinase [Nitrospinota bacterium]
MILAGDIGGTKVNLGLYREVDGRLESVEETRVECSNYSGFEQILDEFIGKTRARPDRACFGVAGPVKDGACEVTNLSWRIESGRIKEQLGIDHVWLINDLAAMACAVPLLGKGEVEVLQQGAGEVVGRITVLAAGTGLGQAFLAPTGVGRYYALETEGGHCDFAPRNPVEIELLRFLLNEFDRVSIERVLSGSGLYQVYRFVAEY